METFHKDNKLVIYFLEEDKRRITDLLNKWVIGIENLVCFHSLQPIIVVDDLRVYRINLQFIDKHISVTYNSYEDKGMGRCRISFVTATSLKYLFKYVFDERMQYRQLGYCGSDNVFELFSVRHSCIKFVATKREHGDKISLFYPHHITFLLEGLKDYDAYTYNEIDLYAQSEGKGEYDAYISVSYDKLNQIMLLKDIDVYGTWLYIRDIINKNACKAYKNFLVFERRWKNNEF